MRLRKNLLLLSLAYVLVAVLAAQSSLCARLAESGWRKDGLRVKTAQKRGVKFGGKPKLSTEQIDHARKLIEAGEGRQYVADLMNVGRVTLDRALSV